MPSGPGRVIRSLIFYGVFYLGTAFYVLLALAVFARGPKALRAAVRRWSAFHRVCARTFLGIRIEVQGAPPPDRVLVAIKHESFFEAIDLPCMLGYPAIFAKAELLEIPLWGRVAARYGMVPVARDEGAKTLRTMLSEAKQFIVQGRSLAIFPEGTRVRHGTAPPLRSGFAGLYKMLGVPVVPVAVNTGPLYHRAWKRAGTVTYLFGEPIPPGLPRAEIEARVAAAINALNSERAA